MDKEPIAVISSCWNTLENYSYFPFCRKEVKLTKSQSEKWNSVEWLTDNKIQWGKVCESCLIGLRFDEKKLREIIGDENKRTMTREYVNSLIVKKRGFKKFREPKKATIRKGIVRFRQEVLNEFQKCVISNVVNGFLLEACHIKPVNKCGNEMEKVDRNNGLAFTSTYHKLFDKGLISFSEEGKILISNKLSKEDIKNLGLQTSIICDLKMNEGRKKYLEWHRINIFDKSKRAWEY